MNNIAIWALITFFCIACQGCYSMIEMAALSFNRIRLQYYVSKGVKRAIWLQYLLQKPYRLFGTIMLGVNVALQVGSQSAREFYRTMHLDPDIAPLTQVFLVVIFAELSPLFAARRCSEHVIMLGTPIVYFTYRLFSPVIWLISLIIRMLYRILGVQKQPFELDLSREELQKTLETHEEEGDEFNFVVSNIFSLRNQTAISAMTRLTKVEMLPAGSSIAEFRRKTKDSKQTDFPLYHKSPANIVAIANARDLVQAPDNKQARDFAPAPWFTSSKTPLTQVLQQFRKHKQRVCIVLSPRGFAIGILHLDTILSMIFGEIKSLPKKSLPTPLPVIQRTFAGNKPILEFNREYGTHLPIGGVETLAQLMLTHLDGPPETGDTITLNQFEFVAEETSLLGIKSIRVQSLV